MPLFSLLLVHSPVVGPSTWSRLAEVARSRAIRTAVPDLTPVIEGSDRPLWPRMVELVLDESRDMKGPITVAGHSAAGALLPMIGSRLGDRLGHLAFVDAVIPPDAGHHVTPPHLSPLLDEQTRGGVLRPWLDWWDESTVASLVPDREDRAVLREDLPNLPRSYYHEEIPVPDGWVGWPCLYLRSSPAYDDELERAGAMGWPVGTLEGTHLSLFTEPETVLHLIEGLALPRSATSR